MRKDRKVLQLAKEYLGEPCRHPYHPPSDCPYLEMRPEEVRKFAKWADRKYRAKSSSKTNHPQT